MKFNMKYMNLKIEHPWRGNAGQSWFFIRATDTVVVTGDSSFITADVKLSEATGDGGDLTINTERCWFKME